MSVERPCILVGVTGCIAAYKAGEIVRGLQKAGVRVKVVMTEHGTHFVDPVTFRALTHEKVAVDLFDDPSDPIHHISLAQECDVFLIAPCTVNVMAKVACGIADDLLSTTALATTATLAIAPAANVHMYEAAATQENMATLRRRGVRFIEGGAGYLACGDVGAGRMSEPAQIVERCVQLLTAARDMQGLRVLVTAGPTCENIDPVRFITNRSSGKMGYALAEAALRRGAQVTLVTGPVSLTPPQGAQVEPVRTTEDLLQRMLALAPEQDIVIQAAAPADYRAQQIAPQKLKKQGDGALTLTFVPTPDVAKAVGEGKRDGQILVGFAAETETAVENARKKLDSKHLDMIVANDVTQPGAGFDVDTNIATIITHQQAESLPIMTKKALADEILTRALALRG